MLGGVFAHEGGAGSPVVIITIMCHTCGTVYLLYLVAEWIINASTTNSSLSSSVRTRA